MKSGQKGAAYSLSAQFILYFILFLCHFQCLPAPNRHQQVRRGKQHMKKAVVFIVAAVSRSPFTEGVFYNTEGMFDFCPDTALSFLDFFGIGSFSFIGYSIDRR